MMGGMPRKVWSSILRMVKSRKMFDPTEYFALHDIVLWTTSLRREGEYQPALHEGKIEIQSMRSVVPEAWSALMEGEEQEVDLIRVLVSLGIRSVVKQGDEAPEVLHSLEATYAVEYIVLTPPSDDDFKKFLTYNCPHQAWPFWRQHVYDTFKRASLPVPVVPLMSARGVSRKRQRIAKISRPHNQQLEQDAITVGSK